MPATKGVQWPGQNNFKAEPVSLFNRTGVTLNKGDVIAIDMANSEAESYPPNCLRNAVTPATANLDGIIGVVTSDRSGGILDDEEFEACVGGPVEAKVDGGTIDVVAGDKLIVTNGSRVFTRSDATTDQVWANALGGNTGTAALKWVFLRSSPTTPGTDEA